ncbi:FadR/GntR family transcriptional regulator [Nocardioides sp. NPDC057772]|uniref:FadR/GntR family transcriptional regulator n=1 Tax=Nocardioides sp. NPDC057772 TaxID=3346245 RepID=UPI003672D60F
MANPRAITSRARSAIFAPIGDEGRAVRVENRLAEAIRSGVLADGDRLPSELELAQMLGVATVTAREALVSLRAQGLVVTTRGRGGGSFVRAPDPGDIVKGRLATMSRVELRDRASLYLVVLTGCAELAAERAAPEEIEDLQDLLIPADEEDVGRWRDAESELYLSVAALTQSARLTREVVRQEADFGTLLRVPLSEPDFRQASAERHRALVTALGSGDVAAARTSVRDHVTHAVERLTEIHEVVRQ